jgi:carbamoyltransferase
MYLSDTYFNSKLNKLNSNDYKERVKFTELTSKIMVERIVEQLISGKYVGIHQAGCEFGPRALGNRSILFDARNANLGKTLNKRLKRTEFMPFAPVVLEEKFSTYFETTNKSLTPFYFMTMTCNVKNDKIVEIPAVVHIDKTARPQIISQKSNQFLYEILSHFFKKTGVPILVNTSLNMHEEPINGALQDSLKTLLVG